MNKEMEKKLLSIGLTESMMQRYEQFESFEEAFEKGESHDITCNALVFLTESDNSKEKLNMINITKKLIEVTEDSPIKEIAISTIDKMLNGDPSWVSDVEKFENFEMPDPRSVQFSVMNVLGTLICSLKEWTGYNVYGWTTFMILLMVRLNLSDVDFSEKDAVDLSRQVREAQIK